MYARHLSLGTLNYPLKNQFLQWIVKSLKCIVTGLSQDSYSVLKFFFKPCHTSLYSCCSSAQSIANFVGRMM